MIKFYKTLFTIVSVLIFLPLMLICYPFSLAYEWLDTTHWKFLDWINEKKSGCKERRARRVGVVHG